MTPDDRLPVTGGDERWREYAQQMADALVAAGEIRDPRWRDAIACTPRHLLVSGADLVETDGDVPQWWLKAVYCDDPAPAGLAWLLDLLTSNLGHDWPEDIREPGATDGTDGAGAGVRVLEVGAGHGYATMLLCQRFGAEYVTATDPHSAHRTREVLAQLDVLPCLVPTQGPRGCKPYGPFDAIRCTPPRSFRLSSAWVEQLADGGRIVTAATGSDGVVDAAVVYRRAGEVIHRDTVTRTHERAGPGR